MLGASWRSQWYLAHNSRDCYSRVLGSIHEEESRDGQGLREELAWELRIGVWPQRRLLLLPPSRTLLGSLPQPLGGQGVVVVVVEGLVRRELPHQHPAVGGFLLPCIIGVLSVALCWASSICL